MKLWRWPVNSAHKRSFSISRCLLTSAARRVWSYCHNFWKRIRSYDYPGNIRELENRIKRVVILPGSHRPTPEYLGFEGTPGAEQKSLLQVREEAESDHICAALVRNNGNVSKAACDLGTSRTTLYDLLEKYKIIKDK